MTGLVAGLALFGLYAWWRGLKHTREAAKVYEKACLAEQRAARLYREVQALLERNRSLREGEWDPTTELGDHT